MTAENLNVVDSAAAELYLLREHWLNKGPLPSVWQAMSPFLRKLKKGQIVNGWKGKTTARLSIRDKQAVGGGSDFRRAFQNHSPPGGKEFGVPLAQHWQHYLVQWELLQVMVAGGVIGNEDVQVQLKAVAESYWSQMSYLVLEDGTGRLAKGNGAWTITGDTITFLNRKCAFRFEEDEVLVFTPFDEVIASGGRGTPRAYTGPDTQNGPKVLAVDEDAGTIKTDQADLSAVITGLTFNDYIGKHSDFGNTRVIDGVFRWVPFTDAEARTLLFGVDRSVRVNRLAGKRIKVNQADSPSQIVSNLLERIPEISQGGINTSTGTICVPALESANLATELASMGYSITQTATDPGSRDPRTLSMGLSGVRVLAHGFQFDIVPDLYLCDKELTAEEDRTYLVTLDGAFHVETTRDGLNWQNRGSGMLERVDGSTNVFSAPYGGACNVWPEAVGDNLLATTRKDDV